MEKILLTGANGFFGSRFQKAYKGRYDVVALDRQELDITNADAVEQAVAQHKPHYILHMAAIAATDTCNQYPDIAYKTNVEGAVHIAKAAKRHGSKLVFFSTEQVFNGNPEKGPYSEADIPMPNTVYGQNKLEAEKLLADILPQLWILRLTWLYGLPEEGCPMNPGILWNTVQTALKGEQTAVSNQEFRGHTYVYDMIEAMEKVFGLPYGLYHIGSSNDQDRYSLSCEILNQMGLGEKTATLLQEVQGGDRDVRLCTRKLQAHGITFEPTGSRLAQVIASSGFRV